MGFRFLVPCVLGCVLGCSSSASSDADPASTDECTAAATRCDKLKVQSCELVSGALHWSASADCADDQVCRDATGCSPLTGDEQMHLTSLATLLTESQNNAARPVDVDYAALGATFRQELLTGDGSPQAYVQTLWDALMSLPQGHQSLAPVKLSSQAEAEAAATLGFGVGPLTIYGTCMSPYLDHAVVTIAGMGSPLHLGDEVVAIDGKRGADLQALVIRQPDGVDLIPPSPTGRFAFAIRSFLVRDRKGTVLTVRRAGATDEIDVTLPAGGALSNAYSCEDPFGRDATAAAVGKLLPDGTGLLYIPSFFQPSVASFDRSSAPSSPRSRTRRGSSSICAATPAATSAARSISSRSSRTRSTPTTASSSTARRAPSHRRTYR